MGSGTQGATVNETEGWVQNLNQTSLNQSLTDYQTRIKTYLDQNNPNWAAAQPPC
jgi:hypothetical protein